ncbi:hypothetical protein CAUPRSCDRAFT_11446, partial [Caulochytrium protostelioides]
MNRKGHGHHKSGATASVSIAANGGNSGGGNGGNSGNGGAASPGDGSPTSFRRHGGKAVTSHPSSPAAGSSHDAYRNSSSNGHGNQNNGGNVTRRGGRSGGYAGAVTGQSGSKVSTTSPAASVPAPTAPAAASAVGAQNSRMLFILMALIGHHVVATTTSGDRYAGIFSASSVTQDLGVSLKMARLIKDGQPQAECIPSLVIEPKDLAHIHAQDVAASAPKPATGATVSGFRTDTAISGKGHGGRERELVVWDAGADATAPMTASMSSLTSGRGGSAGNGRWDQFAVNEAKFGVTTDYSEDAYTTIINKNRPAFREREREAERLAREIESQTTDNLHIQEERNQRAEAEGDVDEEDRYGAVWRQHGAAG